MLKCKYIYENVSYTYDEMINKLIEIYNQNNDISKDGILYSKDDPISVTKAALTNIKKSAQSFTSYNLDAYETEDTIKSTVPLMQVLDAYNQSNNNILYTTYDENDYLNKKRESLEKNKESNIEEILKKTKEDIEYIREKSIFIKKIVRSYFSGVPIDTIVKIYKKDYEDINNLIPVLKEIENNIKKQFGKNAEIYGSMWLTGKTELDTDTSGCIDILVIDEAGIPNIIMVKPSLINSDEWVNVKKIKQNFELAALRQLLQYNGIDVSKTHLGIIPIYIERNEVDTFSVHDIDLRDVHDRKIAAKFDLDSDSPKSYTFLLNSIIKCFFKSNKEIDNKLIDKVKEIHRNFWPTTEIKIQRENATVTDFINSRVKGLEINSKTNETKYKINNYDGTVTYINDEESDKFKSKKILDYVQNLLEDMKKNNTYEILPIWNKLNDIINRHLPANSVFTSNDKDLLSSSYYDRINNIFKKYYTGRWILLENQTLLQLGIISIQNKDTNQIDYIAITYLNPNSKLELKRSTVNKLLTKSYVTSEFERDPQNKFVLEGTNGNITLMDIMIAINEDYTLHPERYVNFSIGNLRVFNPSLNSGWGTYASTSQLLTSFNKLYNYGGTNKNNFANGKLKFADEFKLLLKEFLDCEVISSYKKDEIRNMISEEDVLYNQDKLKIIRRILEIIRISNPNRIIRVSDDATFTEKNLNINEESSENWKLLYRTLLIAEANYASEGTIQFSNDLNGLRLMLDTPEIIDSSAAKIITDEIAEAHYRITNSVISFSQRFHEQILFPYYNKKGYNKIQDYTIGNANVVYNELFERDLDGNLTYNFKNPWDNTINLSDVDRNFLKYYILQIANIRFKSSKGFELITEDNIQDAITRYGDSMFYVPLKAASSTSKWQNTDIVNRAKKVLSRLKFKNKEPQVEDELRRSDIENYKIYNNFKIGDSKEYREEYIQRMLEENGNNYFETNLDNILLAYKFNDALKTELEPALGKIRGIRACIQLYGEDNGIDYKNLLKFIDNHINIAAYNTGIADKSIEKMLPTVNGLKYFTSIIFLAFKPVNVVRDAFEGMWKYTERALEGDRNKSYNTAFKNSTFNSADLSKALGLMLGDSPKFIDHVTLIEALCEKTRMANIDLFRLSDEIKANKKGLTSISSRWMFYTVKCFDYFNRMTMFVAQMQHDGCFDALSFKNGVLKYDWRLDKRFNILASGNKADPKYNEQRAVMQNLLRWLKEDGEDVPSTFSEDMELPFCYSANQVRALKTFSDSTFGYYDQESRMQLEKTLGGMFFMQFKTYLSSAYRNYFAAPGFYGNVEQYQAIDEETGEKLYWSDTEDMKMQKESEGVTSMPVMDCGPGFMQGIIYTLGEVYDILSKKIRGIDTDESIKMLLSTTVNRKNTIKMVDDLLKFLVFFLLLGSMIKLWSENKKKIFNKEKDWDSLLAYWATEQFSKIWKSSLDGVGIIGPIAGVGDVTPVSFSAITNTIDTFTNVIFDGNVNLMDGMFKSVGALKSFRTLQTGSKIINENQ